MNQIEQSIFIVKPDAVVNGDDIVVRREIEKSGLKIVRENRLTLMPEQIEKLYEHRRDNMFDSLVKYLSEGPSIVYLVEGVGVINELLEIKRRMRRDLNYEGFFSGFHCSDDEKSVREEIEILVVRSLVK